MKASRSKPSKSSAGTPQSYSIAAPLTGNVSAYVYANIPVDVDDDVEARAHAANDGSSNSVSGSCSKSPRRQRGDLQFGWAADDASLTNWRDALSEWASGSAGKHTAIRVGNSLLDYLQAHPTVTRSPEAFCRRTYLNPQPWAAWIDPNQVTAPQLLNAAQSFFAWFLDQYLSVPDDLDRPLSSPDHWNPIARQRLEPHASETARQALPTRLIRELLRLLREDDWAWAKQQKPDWVTVVNNEGQPQSIWCPVRASALALKLLLPLRTFQVRMLESGEGDTEILGPNHTWCENTSPLAPPPGSVVRRGFLRAFRDRATGSVTTGFFVNTNKTADRLPDASEVGYEIPWQHEDAIQVTDSLRQWQLSHNPVIEPLAWSALHDRNVRLAGMPRTGRAFFLMRDPKGQHRNEPITDRRVRLLWDALVSALEDRLAERGERLHDGTPLRLTRSVQQGGYERRESIYDLHSLRVSLITALATDGGVPLHILSKCIAGHASLVMTLYYVKTDAVAMTQCLSEATAKIDGASQAQFVRYLRSQARTPEGIVSNDPTGMAALDVSTPASWVMMDTGICPVGGTRCAEGGPLLGKNIHGPVPGGNRNCARCRFHITGPAFLPGLVVRFNTTSSRLDAAKRRREQAQLALQAAEDLQFDAEKNGATDGSLLMRAQEQHERAESSVGEQVGTLQALYALVERCKAIPAQSEGLNLVLAGSAHDLTTTVRLTSELDLLDSVCQAATLYPCEDTAEVSLRRSKALDCMLMREGRMPVMMQLSETDALRVGNELMRLMACQLGRQTALAVVDGTEARLEHDVAVQVDALLASMAESVRKDGTAGLGDTPMLLPPGIPA